MTNNKQKILINTCGVRNKNRVGAIEKIVNNVIDYLSDDFELTIFGRYDKSNEKTKAISYSKKNVFELKESSRIFLYRLQYFYIDPRIFENPKYCF